jgi:hypothetical protein
MTINTHDFPTSPIKAIGMVIYTYAQLETFIDPILQWVQLVEDWSGRSFEAFHFDPRGKFSQRIWVANEKNRAALYQRLLQDQPWANISFGWPKGVLKSSVAAAGGLQVIIKSRQSNPQLSSNFRTPSFLYIEVNSSILLSPDTHLSGFQELAVKAWEVIGGVYGFIDVETGIPLQDDISRNALQLLDSTIPEEMTTAYQRWKDIAPLLDTRVWKPFWGNFINKEHICRIGGLRRLQAEDPFHRRLPAYIEQSYQEGIRRLQGEVSYDTWYDLADNGIGIILTTSPTDPKRIMREQQLQIILSGIMA